MRFTVPPIAILWLLLTVLPVGPAFAQQGQINGVITDSSGGVVPGVSVTAVEEATGLSRETLTGANSVGSASFRRITSTHPNAGDPGIIQFGLKFVF